MSTNPRAPWLIMSAVTAFLVAGGAVGSIWLDAIGQKGAGFDLSISLWDLRHGLELTRLWIFLVVGAALAVLAGALALVALSGPNVLRPAAFSAAACAVAGSGLLFWVLILLAVKTNQFEDQGGGAFTLSVGSAGYLSAFGGVLLLGVAAVAIRSGLPAKPANLLPSGPATGFPPHGASSGGTAASVGTPGTRQSLGWLLFSLDGRIPRRTFWLTSLGLAGAQIALELVILIAILPFGSEVAGITALLFAPLLVALVAIVPGVCVQGKRWHDRDKSAWWILIGLIPVIGMIWAIVESGFLRGTVGPNRFGPDTLTGSTLIASTGAPTPWSQPASAAAPNSGWSPMQPQPGLFVPAVPHPSSAATTNVTPPAGPDRFTSEPALAGGSDAHAGCVVCDHVVGVDDRFCRGCGSQQPLPPPRCPACDHVAPVGDRFCTECGAGLAV